MTRETVGMLVHPSMLISANGRGAWQVHAPKIADLRLLSRARLGPLINPITARVRVTVIYCYPVGYRGAVKDAANLAPSTKAIIDGLTDAKVWPDDNDKWVEGPDNRLGPKSRHPHKCEVWLTLEKAGPRWVPPAGMDRLV